MNFISENLGTIIVGIIVLAIVAAISLKLFKDKKEGKSSCGSSCKCCPNSALCHSQKGKRVKH